LDTTTRTPAPKYTTPNFVTFVDDIVVDLQKEYRRIIQEFEWRIVDVNTLKCVCKNKQMMIVYLKKLLEKIKAIRNSDEVHALRSIESETLYLIYELENYYIKYDKEGNEI